MAHQGGGGESPQCSVFGGAHHRRARGDAPFAGKELAVELGGDGLALKVAIEAVALHLAPDDPDRHLAGAVVVKRRLGQAAGRMQRRNVDRRLLAAGRDVVA